MIFKRAIFTLIIIINYNKINYDREILCLMNNDRVQINR